MNIHSKQGTAPLVLVVEDDPMLAGVLVDALNSAGLRGTQALTLAEARKNLVQSPNLLLLDWSLPDGEGVSLIEEMRSDTRLSHIPILMLTGRTNVRERVKGLHLGADDYMTKPFSEEELMARVSALLRRTHRDMGASPLTGLPGNLHIEEEVEKRLKLGLPFDAVYLDIDHFKPYNDRYGFGHGDRAIRLLAECLLSAAEPNTFIGHIGGDDFVIVLPALQGEAFANRVLALFPEKAKQLHDKVDQIRGYFESKDRQGNPQIFPLLTCTAAVISTSVRQIEHYAELAQAAAELKSAARKEGVPIRCERRLT